MPVVLASGDIVEVRYNYVQNGQRLMNVFHYRLNTTETEADYDTYLEYLTSELAEGLDYWSQKWATNAAEQCSIYKIDAQRIFPTRTYHISKPVEIPGEIAALTSEPLPQNVQLSLTKVSAESGRGRTGRVEVPGGTQVKIEGGRLSTDGQTWLTDLALAVQETVPTDFAPLGEWIPVILYGFAPAGSPDIVTVRVQDTVRVSHRRTVGVGE